MNYKGKKIGIVGLGRSGRSAVIYLSKRGADLFVTDQQPALNFSDFIQSGTIAPERCYFGTHENFPFLEMELIIASPGVDCQMHGLLEAKKKEIPVVSELELAIHECQRAIIAITGTNGKSTTTTLIGNMLKDCGIPVVVGGNLGTPYLEMIEEAKSARYVVLEISSYQAEITPTLKPFVAVVLNVTPDHLDRYDNFDAYVKAKMLMLKNMDADDHIVFNQQDSIVSKYAGRIAAVKHPFMVDDKAKERFASAKLVGLHNLENMVAAFKVAQLLKLDEARVLSSICSFSGLPHRNEFVAEINGIRFFDDSKGTNVGAVQKSLESFSEKIVWIAGGQEKGWGYVDLLPLVRKKVRCAIFIGEAQKNMAAIFEGIIPIRMANSMPEAVQIAFAEALGGDVVLLSPACSSFDMFANYAQRGRIFQESVRRLM